MKKTSFILYFIIFSLVLVILKLWISKCNLKYKEGNASSVHQVNLLSKEKTIHEKCGYNAEPRKSIFYIKVQKTGSTTIRSTLLSYGRYHNLTICMDSMNLWGLNWPYEIDGVRLTKHFTAKCDIIAEELVYKPEIGNNKYTLSLFLTLTLFPSFILRKSKSFRQNYQVCSTPATPSQHLFLATVSDAIWQVSCISACRFVKQVLRKLEECKSKYES